MSLLEHVREPCPYCGEWLELSVEPGLTEQTYVEDCQVCCSPMLVTVRDDGGGPWVTLAREDGAGC